MDILMRRGWLLFAALSGCWTAHVGECRFVCDSGNRCPGGFVCGDDGYCHGDGKRDGCQPGRSISFASALSYPSGVQPTSLAVGDFNQDHVDDVAVGVHGSGISIFRGTQTTLAGPGGISQSGLGTIATGDFNGDGNLDLI